jgi:hypothetical protein
MTSLLRKTPRVLLSADTPALDSSLLKLWREEGFTVSYLQFNGNKREFDAALHTLSNGLPFGEEFCLIGKKFPSISKEINNSSTFL